MELPIKYVKPLAEGVHSEEDMFSWVVAALKVIQDNQAEIYGLLFRLEKKIKD